MGNRIKALRQENGLTQVELAKRCNVSTRLVQWWESGGRDPSTDELKTMADIFDCSIDYMLCRANVKYLQRYRRAAEKISKIEDIADIKDYVEFKTEKTNYVDEETGEQYSNDKFVASMNRIKESRESIGMTQRELSTEMGVTARTVQRWESGESEPSFQDLRKLSALFDCTIDYLICNSDTKKV